MKRSLDDVLAHGLVGGILAGLVVALWFLVVDAVAGQPFRTPAVLAYILFKRPTLDVSVELVTMYTILHLGMFAFLGVAAAWVLAELETPPGILIGAVFGLFVLDFVFYAALLLTGARILGVLPWQHVLAANILGGMAMMTYLHQAGREPGPLGWSVLRGYPLLTKGLVTGLLGAAAVALWFFLLDAAGGRPFRTPAALGSALFFGASSPAEVQASLGVVAAYTVLHLAAFWAVGVGLVAVAEQIERTPGLVLLVTMAFIILEAVFVTTLALGAEWVLGTLGWWSVAVGNLVAVGVMGWQVWRTHPELRRRLRDKPLEVRA